MQEDFGTEALRRRGRDLFHATGEDPRQCEDGRTVGHAPFADGPIDRRAAVARLRREDVRAIAMGISAFGAARTHDEVADAAR